MKETDKYAAIHYSSYLQLEKLLDAQHTRSGDYETSAHDETLFIIIHQVYELWFKQVLHELQSVMGLFENERVDEKNIGIAVSRIGRINEILKLLTQQIRVLETMTPLDFLEFRNYLFPASGFQSFQFRKMEVLLGLKLPQRHSYTNHSYYKDFADKEREDILKFESSQSLFDLIEKWLERTPFIEFKNFSFIQEYKISIERMLQKEREAILKSDYLSDDEKNARLKMLGDSGEYFESVLNPSTHNEKLQEGVLRLSFKATMAALLIHLYRDEPILQLPFRLLTAITEMDELLTGWRYRHAQMVMRMLGRKSGTGGSSGFDYLMETVMKHQIFKDFHHISTLMIPRSELPILPEDVQKTLGFYYSYNK
ncbi:MAG: tryptophan 2,3-dioxygenase [Bacteroidota bacterium]|nr:tryptophan 2,3-dioxygenase [Bacteroidota bacterium]